MTAFTAIAKPQIGGKVSERWVVDRVVEITQPYFDDSITSLPLGQLFSLGDEWDGCWGRTDDQLRTVAQQACIEQLRAATAPRARP
jgi:hypothetical protein